LTSSSYTVWEYSWDPGLVPGTFCMQFSKAVGLIIAKFSIGSTGILDLIFVFISTIPFPGTCRRLWWRIRTVYTLLN